MEASGRHDPEAPVEPPRRPEEAIGLPIPDVELPSSRGGTFSLRSRVGLGPIVFFFYIHNGTPG